ncbi:O-antigen ligase family protein [Nocardioides sp.]|uniref:O-antigen ligase family protein n=1 Tax=Nocardioides sp. TaxID=35761 RepID=UPI002B26CAE5|nr:O-antigen ligase family protein [Nocardioides sp.]
MARGEPAPGERLRAVALVLAVSAPLWWLPGGFSRFVLAKLLVTAIAVLLAALARPVGALPRTVVLAGVGWAGCFALAALVGETPLASLLGRWPRYEGLPVLGLYAAACWTGARVVGQDVAATRRLHLAVSALAVALAAFSVLDVLGVTPLGPSTEDRTGSVLGNATDQGAVAMMAALVLVGPALRPAAADRALRAASVAGLAAAVATVAISGSRTALGLTLVGLAAIGAVLLLRSRADDRTTGALPLTAGAVALLGSTALLVPTTRDRLLGLGTAEGRVDQWRLTLDLLGDHPWLGLGGSRYVDAFLAYEDPAFVDFTGAQRLADSPHSVLLQVLVAGGVLLMVATLLGLFLVVRRVVAVLRERPDAVAVVGPVVVAVAAYLTLASVNFTTAGPACLAALLLGTVIAVPIRAAEQERRSLPLAAMSGVLVVGLAAATLGEVALERGVAAADRRQVAAADERFAEAGRWRPWDVDVDVIAARLLAEQAAAGDGDAAIRGEQRARAALAGAPQSYEATVALGLVLSAQGRLAEAVEVLGVAVTLAPERPDGHVQRGIAHAGLGQVDDALVDLRRAQEILPRSAVVRRLIRQVSASTSP